jgi:hypothetical protein
MEESVDIQINYAKDEIEIRAESLKIEIDQLKEKFINKLDEIKNEFNEYRIFIFKQVSIFLTANIF